MSNIVTLDFETFFDPADKYGFGSMTTEEYIRDRRWQTIGFGAAIAGGEPQWVSGTDDQIAAALHALDLPNKAVIMQNAMFDAAVLNWRYGIRPKFIFDTLSMARGYVGLRTSCSLAGLCEFFKLPVKKGNATIWAKGLRREDFSPQQLYDYGEYCKDDVRITWELFNIMAPHVANSEMQLIDWTVRAFSEPELELDAELIEQEYRAFLARREGLLSAAGVHDISELRSDARMADLLIAAGVEPPTKISQTTGEIAWAFSKSDIEFMDLLEHENEAVVALVEARIGAKTSQVQSRLERFLGIARRGRLPVPTLYAGATPTRRWSGTDKINLQNLPRNKVKRTIDKQIVYENGRPVIEPSPLRRAIRAPAGKKLAVGDLSQIELRVNAWQSGQNDVIELLRAGGDPYSDMATSIYGFEITKAMGKSTHTNERFVGKTAVLGCGYQCGGPKFQHMLKVGARRDFITLPDESLDFAQKVVTAYRQKNNRIRDFWYRAGDVLEALAQGGSAVLGPYCIRDYKLFLPDGSHLYYPDLALREKSGRDEQGVEWSYIRRRGRGFQQTKLYGGKLVENITQAVARLFVSDALLRLQSVKYQNGTPVFKVVLSVHDELAMTVEEGLDDDWIRETMKWAFTTTPEWAPDIPLAYEGDIAKTYADCK